MSGGFPRLCVSLGHGCPEQILAQLDGLDFAEVRLDLVDFAGASDLSRDLAAIFVPRRLTIATCRPGSLAEPLRFALISMAIACGAQLADLELEAPTQFQRRIGAALHARGGRLILSHHDFERTPSDRALRRIAADGFERGADIVKLACAVNSAEDAARLLDLLDLLDLDVWRGRIVLAGLGHLGGLFRCLALLRGAPFTYAAPDVGPKVAAAQPRASDLRRAMIALTRFQQQQRGDRP